MTGRSEATNQETGGSVVDMAEAEYLVRANGYLKTLDDFRAVPVKTAAGGTPVRLGDVATVQIGPALRLAAAELNGEGEVAGGVVVLRSGENARATLAAVKAKLQDLKRGLPAGVEIVPTYDRSEPDRPGDRQPHAQADRRVPGRGPGLRPLPLACPLGAGGHRHPAAGGADRRRRHARKGVNANIMSLGGIAIAIGAMVDAAIVMIENAHKHIEQWGHEHRNQEPTGEERWRVITQAAVEVGPALCLSLLIITFSFIPVFTLQGQEGRLFAPLAFTKTYAMAAAAILSITLVPVLMGYLIRGRIPQETANPINRWLIGAYRPAIDWVISRPRLTLVLALMVFATTAWPLSQLGGEFMPAMNEGDLLYMPSALPGLSIAKAGELLQQTDRLIKTVPEVETVFGKAGRADTATDPAPTEMFETIIQFKPRDQWRPGMTPDKLVEELDRRVKIPGLAKVWVPPIRNRIDMLATGIKSPIGVKVSGDDLAQLDRIGREVETAAKTVPGVSSALAERLSGGRYINVAIDRAAAARYGLNIADVQSVVSGAVGGEAVGQTVEGLARYPISVRYPREVRDSLEKLRALPILTPALQQITLGTVADIGIGDGPSTLRSENGRPTTWVYIDTRGRALTSVVRDLRRAVDRDVKLSSGVSIAYTGQFEYLQHAVARLKLVVPATLLIIFVLFYLIFRRFDEAALIMLTLPFALTGGRVDALSSGLPTVGRHRRSASSPWPACRPSSAW